MQYTSSAYFVVNLALISLRNKPFGGKIQLYIIRSIHHSYCHELKDISNHQAIERVYSVIQY